MAANNPHMLMASLGKQHRMCVENGVKALSKWALKFGDRSDMDEDPILQLFSCEDHSLISRHADIVGHWFLHSYDQFGSTVDRRR